MYQQECIPVGCVLPAAIAIFPAMHTPLPCMPQPCMPPAIHAPLCQACPPAKHAPCHACPPATHAPLPCMLPTMHAPLPCTPPCHACPPAMHSPLTHTPPAMHAPHHACPPAMHTPCGQNSWHTFVKILPCRNFVAGGKNLQCEVGIPSLKCQHIHNCRLIVVVIWRTCWMNY